MTSTSNDYKQLVGFAAADRVRDGMVVGLGTGSTAYHMIVRLGERVAHGELPNIWGFPLHAPARASLCNMVSASPRWKPTR
ncbi:MAG UNVERIFIED_CONTAM: hypothetical protein LVT10_23665 [Anaerolineae bacterium]|jgi:ribose 5-phosphate isomerase